MDIIPKNIVEEADFIRKCVDNNKQYVILKPRSMGGTMAKRLATETIDVDHVEVNTENNGKET